MSSEENLPSSKLKPLLAFFLGLNKTTSEENPQTATSIKPPLDLEPTVEEVEQQSPSQQLVQPIQSTEQIQSSKEQSQPAEQVQATQSQPVVIKPALPIFKTPESLKPKTVSRVPGKSEKTKGLSKEVVAPSAPKQSPLPPSRPPSKPRGNVLAKSTKELKSKPSGDVKMQNYESTIVDEKYLRELSYYHGYLPREDLPYILRSEGDFILRMSEVDIFENSKPIKPKNPKEMKPNKKNQTNEHNENAPANNVAHGCKSKMHRELIVSVYSTSSPGNPESTRTMNTIEGIAKRIRNLVLIRVGTYYRVENARTFHTIPQLLAYYKDNFGLSNTGYFKLKNGVGLLEWEYLHSHITFTGKVLGEGEFGLEGQLNVHKKNPSKDTSTVAVAVKYAKGVGATSKAKIKELMREARLMRKLENHENVVKFYGVSVLEHPLYIILELVEGGELRKYLMQTPDIPLKERLSMCLQAAKGIEHMHSFNYIHRDLAARNCLYTNHKVLKISDFGLTRRKIHYEVRSNTKLPTKWLSPETLAHSVSTPKSDVFSYGVLVYEIFANGTIPWAHVKNQDAKANVLNGKFLSMPECCPSRFTVYIKDYIFLLNPKFRANMSEVVAFLNIFIDNPSAAPDPPRIFPNEPQKWHFLKVFKRTGPTGSKDK